MAQQGFQFVTDPAQVDLQQIARRRRVAEMLLGQSAEPLQTNRMAGGYVVPINPMEGLAKMAQAWASGKIERDADAQTRRIGEEMAADRADTLRRAMEAGQGTPAVNPMSATDALPGEPMQVPARPGSPRAMYEVLMNSRDPSLQQAGMAQLLKSMAPIPLGKDQRLVTEAGAELVPMAPQRPNWQIKEIKAPNGGVITVQVDMNAPDPLSTARQISAQGPAHQMVNTGGSMTPVNPFTQTDPLPVTAAPGAVPFAATGMTPEQFRLHQQSVAAAGAARNTNVNNVNAKPDNAYFTERRKQQAEQFQALEKAAHSADQQISALDRFLKANETGTAGGAQPLISGVQNFLSSFGFDPKGLTDVRMMEQVIGDILQNKMSELGARGLTDKDMQILREAMPRVATDRNSREKVANILKTAAQNTINNYLSARAEEARVYPEFAANNMTPLWLKKYENPQGGAAQTSPPHGGGGRVVVDY